MTRRISLSTVLAAALALGTGLTGQEARTPPTGARVDEVMSRWNKATPGCAVGVSVKGERVLERGYGMADLEHDVANSGDTVFEAGSVSKQFTAAAVLLLARDGKLSLDDPARKYIPELPDYGAPLTIRHMLNHTSGLRDWGSVAAIAGWPRTTRVHTHAHVLDIVSRQRALNFPPGSRWSYTNSGYNLAAVIVSRVSGRPFAEFTQARIFSPLGMTRTSWRDDYTRIVKHRAIAYSLSGQQFSLDMPFENVHGNGGLLTTVGDLLKWTRNFSQPKVGDAAFVDEVREPGRFSDGRRHDYALGVRVVRYRGVREVSHSGATAGYRAYLSDYPDHALSVAVLCNAGHANAEQYAHAVADAYLDLPRTPDATSAIATPTAAPAGDSGGRDPLAGLYRRTDAGGAIVIAREGKDLSMDGGVRLVAKTATQFTRSNGEVFDFASDHLKVTDAFGSVQTYVRVGTAEVAAKPVADYVGTYASDEAEVSMTAAVESGTLVLKRRPESVIRLSPVYADAFRSSLGFVRFHRDADGRVGGFSVTQDRVWDLRFTRR